ncbi:MAG: DUF1572 family protein [Pirellulales bacterium]
MTTDPVHEKTIAAAYLMEAPAQLRESLRKIEHCVDQLSDEQLWWRPTPDQNSIANLLLHLSGNVRQWIVSGVGDTADTRDRPSEFIERGPIPRANLLETIRTALDDACNVISAAPPETLLEMRRVQGFDVTPLTAIFDSTAHFEGHMQEIICLTRMQLGDRYRFDWMPTTAEQGAPGP